MVNEMSRFLGHPFKTVSNLADAFTRKAQASSGYMFSTSLFRIESMVNSFDFQNNNLRRRITICVMKIWEEEVRLARLPIVLTHKYMTQFNYLFDMGSGEVTAILD